MFTANCKDLSLFTRLVLSNTVIEFQGNIPVLRAEVYTRKLLDRAISRTEAGYVPVAVAAINFSNVATGKDKILRLDCRANHGTSDFPSRGHCLIGTCLDCE
jgi:hypothetical protein